MKRYWVYLLKVLRHKWFVFLACCDLGIPFLGIIHDWSKFLPSEFIPYAMTFYNSDGSEKEGGFREAGDYPKYALNEHFHRNKHHWSRWMLPDGECLPIPDRYRREMLADWIGAGRAYGGSGADAWYAKHKDELKLHPLTRSWMEEKLFNGG